jgi:hypothetical protein
MVANKRAVARFQKEPGVHERAQNGQTRGLVKAPETPGLIRSKPQPRHLEILPTYSSDHFLNPYSRVHHCAPGPVIAV